MEITDNRLYVDQMRQYFKDSTLGHLQVTPLAPATTCISISELSLSPSTHQNMADKTTRIYNGTEDTMVFVTKDQYNATRKTKKIGAGKHIVLSYRDGMVSSNPFIKILYEIYPADKDNGWSLREIVLPIQVFDHSEIKISYNIESGKVALAYETGGVIQRLRMVRWMKDLFSVRFKASC